MRKEIKMIIKSLVYTVLAAIFSIWVIFSIFMNLFQNPAPGAEAMYMIFAFFITTIFTIILCTLILLDKLENKDK